MNEPNNIFSEKDKCYAVEELFFHSIKASKTIKIDGDARK